MSFASYEREQLALYAAGHITGNGASANAQGCGLTRVGEGVYAVVFGNDAGLVDGQSYTFVTVKYGAGMSGGPRIVAGVEDTSNLVKTIYTSAATFTGPGVTFVSIDAPQPGGLEIAVYRSVQNP